MIVIICAKYKNNPSRTVDATEQTRFSKSRPNDLEDIGQGQRSLSVTHPLMVVIICGQYGKNPSRTVDVTERTRQAGQTDGRTDGPTKRCLVATFVHKFGCLFPVWLLEFVWLRLYVQTHKTVSCGYFCP